MALLRCLRFNVKYCAHQTKYFSQEFTDSNSTKKFDPVFSFPSIKYISMLNRLKVYHIAGTCIAIPSCGVLEMASLLPNNAFLSASYIGLTGVAVLCLATLPFRNIIGFLYISEDNKNIKISSVNFWGKRIDKVIPVDDWIPLLEMSTNILDPLYLTPKLTDGTKYKLLIKFGQIINEKKIGQFLE